ncbi:MAG: rhodanese-like domain-containing protein [Salibacteraceae bacterium]
MRNWAFKKLVDSLLSDKVEIVLPKNVSPSKTVFLDARNKEEFEVSHLPNAIWVGYSDFDIKRVDLPKNTDLTVYCSLGKRSDDIGLKLQQAGFNNVKNLYGGIFQWVNEGFSVEDSTGPTQKVHVYSKTWGIWLQKGDKVY